MGRLEKIVVLTVVFLIAVILGISLNETDVSDPVPDESVETGAPGSRTEAVLSSPRSASLHEPLRLEPDPVVHSQPSERPAPNRGAGDRAMHGLDRSSGVPADALAQLDPELDQRGANARRGGGNGRKLLNSAVELDAPDGADLESKKAAEKKDGESILVKTRGLTETHDDQYMLYTWKAGDTFTSVAREYYASMAHVRLLRLANEGRTERTLAAGDEILVPVHEPGAGERANEDTYTVLEGDTLSSIAQKIYGDPSKYRKIFEANRDILADENTLGLGQELRIPR